MKLPHRAAAVIAESRQKCHWQVMPGRLAWTEDVFILDAFGCHGVGGIFGGLATAIFTTPDLALDKANIGLIYGKAHLFIVTILAIIFTAIWSALVTYGIIKVIAHYMPLRVSDRDEAIGLDDSEHKETAYPTFMGLDS